jgi:phage/conjugal plasmid C-4 type zinc finger TraR family protein
VSDVVDDANARVELDTRLALEAHQRRQPAAGPMCTECEDCSGEIEPARLKVLPYASRCASCAHDYERRREP